MNDREQVLQDRERASREHVYAPDAPEPDLTAWASALAHRVRVLYESLVREGFTPQEALLLTGRLFEN